METRNCPNCNGLMYHSSDMENPYPDGKDGDLTPYWQCEDCGFIVDNHRPTPGDFTNNLFKEGNANT